MHKMAACGNEEFLDSAAYMKLALQQAKLALDCLEVPVGLQDMQRWKLLMFCLSGGRKMDYQRQKLLKDSQNALFMLHVNHV